MANVSNLVIGKASVSGKTFKVDGKKYELTDAFAPRAEKLDLNGSTAIFVLNKGKIDRVIFNGAITAKAVDTPKFGGEGTYKCDYIAVMGYSCNLKDGNPVRFSIRTYGKKAADAEPETTFYEMKAWEDLGEKAKVELAVPEGEKAPKVWAIARITKYNGKDQYTLVDYGVVAE